MTSRRQRGSAAVDYLGAIAAVGLLMVGLLALRTHHPSRQPPIDPVARIGRLVRPAPVVPPPRRPPRARPTRPRPRPARPRPPRLTIEVPAWALGP